MKVIFSDNLHFNQENFASLIEAVALTNTEQHYNTEYTELMTAQGDYWPFLPELQATLLRFDKITKSELLNYEHKGHNIFEIVKAELQSYIIPTSSLRFIEASDECTTSLFDVFYDEYRDDLLLNYAAAVFWFDHWHKVILIEHKDATHAFTHSGSSIYSKTFTKTCQYSPTRVFTTEFSFTGNEFTIEERLTPIANNSHIRHKNVFNSYQFDSLPIDTKSSIKRDAFNKLRNSSNKNVKQPKEHENITFSNRNKVITIVGQVINDYSLIETQKGFLSSLTFYKDIIDTILDCTDLNIIFKAHPWENNKIHCNGPITASAIEEHIENHPHQNQLHRRVKVVENVNIHALYDNSDFVVLINSQSGIEAAHVGIKPIVFGNPFYKDFGFTFNCANSDDFIRTIENERGTLSLDEYAKFERFVAVYLGCHLYSNNAKSRDRILKDVLGYHQPINKLIRTLTLKKQSNNLENTFHNAKVKFLKNKNYRKFRKVIKEKINVTLPK